MQHSWSEKKGKSYGSMANMVKISPSVLLKLHNNVQWHKELR